MKSKLLRPKNLVPVKMDIFCHDAKVLADVREALSMGLKPVAFALIGDSVVLRLKRNESRKPLQEE